MQHGWATYTYTRVVIGGTSTVAVAREASRDETMLLLSLLRLDADDLARN